MLIKHFQLIILSIMISFGSKALDKNYASFITAHKVSVIDNKLEQAKSFEELHNVLVLIGEIVFKNYGDTCKDPTISDYRALCISIASRAYAEPKYLQLFNYHYEQKLLELSCVNIGVDSEEMIKLKVQKWWNKYKTSCKCDSVSFGLSNGNLLKFALSQNFTEVIDDLASYYKLDINFKDPADGLNLLDYIISEKQRLQKQVNSESAVNVYENYKAIIIGLGGKSVNTQKYE